MAKRFFLFSLLALLLHPALQACSCFPTGAYFCETLQNDTSIHSVVMVRKTSDYYYGMKVELIRQVGGAAMPDSFIVWGDNGALCRLYTGGWAIGDTIIMALHRCDTAGNMIWDSQYPPDLESVDDYHISVCGVYTLAVINGVVTGYNTAATMQYVPLASWLQNNCAIPLGNAPVESIRFHICPNPVSAFLIVSLESMLAADLRLLDISGRLIYQQLTISGQTTIDISQVENGVYILQLSDAEGHIYSRRVIKY